MVSAFNKMQIHMTPALFWFGLTDWILKSEKEMEADQTTCYKSHSSAHSEVTGQKTNFDQEGKKVQRRISASPTIPLTIMFV